MKKNPFPKSVINAHKHWHKFSDWLTKNYGKDLFGEWKYLDEKNKKFRYRNFDEGKLYESLVGYEVICKVEKYLKRAIPQIKVLSCDDNFHSGSLLLLIPHPKHGITVLFIPQNTTIQSTFFLYERHCTELIKELTKMKRVYKEKL